MIGIGVLAFAVLWIIGASFFRSRKRGLDRDQLDVLPVDSEPVRLENDRDPWLRDVRIYEEIGRGNYGIVYKGTIGGREVACKSIKGDVSELEDEARRLMRMRDPRVVNCYGVAKVDGHTYMIMQYVSGGSLLDYLRRERSEPLRFNVLMDLCISTSAVIKYLHETAKLIHRDLSARNLLISDDRGRGSVRDAPDVKIADVGLSRFASCTGDYISYATGVATLPVRWSPPEVMRSRRFTFSSDIWSLGVVLWEILSLGAVPYEELKSNEAVMAAVFTNGERLPIPTACQYIDVTLKNPIFALLMSCWDSNPDARPTAGQVHVALTDLLEVDAMSDVFLSGTDDEAPVYHTLPPEY
jgi:serine/threonine protein kinase